MNLKAPAETGTLGSRINRSHRLVVVVVDEARVPAPRFMTPPTSVVGRSSSRFLIVRKPGICTHIICSISNFQFHVARPNEMWVTRQIAAHAGQHRRRSVALIDYLSTIDRLSVTADAASRGIEFERSTIFFQTILVGEKRKKRRV